MIGSVVIGGLNAVLYCAIIIFVAFCIVWAFKIFGFPIDPDVYKWGKIIVGLFCLIVIISWLLSLLGIIAGPPPILGHVR